jgi:N-acetylmuramoyl-L-alanine amidase
LNSEEGQNKMALQIANAIIAYKKEYFGEEINLTTKGKPKETVLIPNKAEQNSMNVSVLSDTVYKVQLFASSKKLELDSNKFKGLKNISSTFNNNLYRYTYGETSNFDEVYKMQKEAKQTGFTDAYIVVIKDGKSSKVNKVIKQ